MSESILIPLDGSDVWETALRYVEGLVSRMAPGEKVEVTLLQVITSLRHAVSTPGGTIDAPYSDKELEELKAKAMEYLTKAGESLQSRGASVNCKVSVGKAAEEIIQAENEVNADLVAMSTHGRSGLSQWAFGSVTARVLRGGNVPLLMVRAIEDTMKK